MKLKNFTLKTLTALAFMLLAFAAHSQQTETLGVPTNFNYVVDIDPANGGATPDGTLGSTYTWTLPDGGGTFVADAFPNDNKATINWSTAGVGTYRVRVVETNASCPIDTEEFTVTITTPGNPLLNWIDTAPICKDDDATFEITGAPAGAIISFTATGGTPATGTVTANPSGVATIAITHDGTSATIVVNLISMNVGGNTVTFTSPVPTDTADVNIVQTSPIQLVP